MNKKLLFNLVMIILIAAVILGSIMTIGYFGNWFKSSEKCSIVSKENDGSVMVIRRGTGYFLKNGISLTESDIIKTSVDASAVLSVDDKNLISLDEDSAVRIDKCEPGNTSVEPQDGAAFIETGELKPSDRFELTVREAYLNVSSNTILSLEVFNGTQTINVYSGSAELTFENQKHTISAGSSAVILQDEDGASSVSFMEAEAERLSSFLIGKLLTREDACFSQVELNDVIKAREAETAGERQEQLAHEKEVLSKGGTVPILTINPDLGAGGPVSSSNGEASVEGSTDTGGSGGSTGKEPVYTCTVQIRCELILSNLDKLSQDKQQYVPNNGIIFDTVKVQFVQGETVYNILKRICTYGNIPLEYSWAVKYNSYYIEGINNLFEFDCGSRSGWMYKVNGWYPNYGCSNYAVKDGDIIVWAYTCDLGKDLGAEMH